MTRTAGKLGRRPQRQGNDRFAIAWAHEYGIGIGPTGTIDVSRGITDWGMLGNDTLGDCGPAAEAHDRMLAGAHPTDQEVTQWYLAYDNGEDNGVIIADMLLAMFHQGMIDAFAPVAINTIDNIMGATTRGILLGVNLTDNDLAEFNAENSWGAQLPIVPDPNNGHVVLKVKSLGVTSTGTCVTWGALQDMTEAWQRACIDEAWVIITKDDVSEADFNQLVTDLRAIPHATVAPSPPTVTPSTPAPTPTPAPAPQPAPAPVPNAVASFPGATVAVDHFIVEAARKRNVTPSEYQNVVWCELIALLGHIE